MADREIKGIQLSCEIPDIMPKTLVGDPNRLGQVLTNIVANALKFTEKGQVFVFVENRKLNQDMIELLFCVKDSGIGIKSEFRDQLFEAFTQADGSITRKYGGTGLGLTICKKIVTRHGGDITFKNKPTHGVTFYITLPEKQADR